VIFQNIRVIICLMALLFAAPTYASGVTEDGIFGPYYKELPPVTVSIIQDGVVTDHVTFVLILEVESESDIERIMKFYPKFRSEYVNYLHSIASNSARTKLNNQAFLKRKFKRMTNDIVGESLVQQVLFKMHQNRQLVVG